MKEKTCEYTSYTSRHDLVDLRYHIHEFLFITTLIKDRQPMGLSPFTESRTLAYCFIYGETTLKFMKTTDRGCVPPPLPSAPDTARIDHAMCGLYCSLPALLLESPPSLAAVIRSPPLVSKPPNQTKPIKSRQSSFCVKCEPIRLGSARLDPSPKQCTPTSPGWALYSNDTKVTTRAPCEIISLLVAPTPPFPLPIMYQVCNMVARKTIAPGGRFRIFQVSPR